MRSKERFCDVMVLSFHQQMPFRWSRDDLKALIFTVVIFLVLFRFLNSQQVDNYSKYIQNPEERNALFDRCVIAILLN